MRKNVPYLIFYILVLAVVIFNTAVNVKNGLFFDIEDLPTGTLIYSSPSPEGDSTLNIYRVQNVLGTAVRGEVADQSGTDNIFWQTDIDTVDAVWLDNDSVEINGIPLIVSKGGTYDCRRGSSLFQDGAVDDAFVPEKEHVGAE